MSDPKYPRYMCLVIRQMLDVVPPTEKLLRAALEQHFEENRYVAPECHDWGSVSRTLALYLEGCEDTWVEKTLSVWRDEQSDSP